MRPRSIIAASLVLALGCTESAFGQLSRWVDERGVIHYADAAPEARRSTAGTIPDVGVAVSHAAAPTLAPRPRSTAVTVLMPGSPSAIDRATAESLSNRVARTTRVPPALR